MYISISRGDQCDALLMFCDVVVILHHVISVQMYFESDQKFITPIALPIGRSAEHVYFSDWTNASTLTSDQKRRFRQCEEYSMYLATLDVVSHFIVQHSRVLILRSCDLLAMPFASPSPSRYFLQVEVHSLEWLVSKLIEKLTQWLAVLKRVKSTLECLKFALGARVHHHVRGII